VSLEAVFAARPELVNPPLAEVAAMSDAEFRQRYRHSPLKRAKLRGILRSAAIALGNSGDPEHLPRLRELAQHENPAVAEHARWAIARLEGSVDGD
jgi:epoxyqueuosine reductase